MKRLNDREIETELGGARSAFLSGNVRAALSIIDRVLSSNPDSGAAHLAKGVIQATAAQWVLAKKSLLQALRYLPENHEALSWAAIACLNLQQGAEAERLSVSLAKAQPRNDRAHFLVTNSLCMQGRFEEGLTSLERCLSLRSLEPDYIVAKAQILRELNWSSQAIEWYRRAYSLRPAPQIALELASLLLKEGQIKDSISLLERVAPECPPESGAYALLAQALTEAQKFEQASSVWIAAEHAGMKTTDLVLIRADAETFAGRLSVAEGILREAIETFPNEPELYCRLTGIVKVSGADCSLIDKMEDLNTNSHLDKNIRKQLYYSLGKAYHDLREFRRAIDSLRPGESNRPPNFPSSETI